MGANINPIFSKIGKIGLNGGVTHGTALDTTYDGTDADVKLLFTADATNGSYVQYVRLSAIGTNAVSKAKLYINNGTGAVGTATNNTLFSQTSLPATAAITTAATQDVIIPLNIALPAGYKLYLGIDAASALASGWSATVVAGDY